MTTIMTTPPTLPLPSPATRVPIYPPPASVSDPTAIQSLAINIVGVLFTGAGLVLLAIQLRRHRSNRPSEDGVQIELQRHTPTGEENV